jgi:Protein-disulfide isomerase
MTRSLYPSISLSDGFASALMALGTIALLTSPENSIHQLFHPFENLEKPEVAIEAGAQASTSAPSADTSTCTLQSSSVPDSLSLYSENAPVLGSRDVPVRILEFFDPFCPHCQRLHNDLLPKLRSEIPTDSVAIYMRPFPLSKTSVPAILALYHAEEQGQFSELLDVMFTFGQPSKPSRKAMGYLARAADLDPNPLFRSLSTRRFQDRLDESVRVAEALGIRGTPTVFLGQRKMSRTSYEPECMAQLIRSELRSTTDQEVTPSSR